MSFNPEESIQALYDDFKALVDFASDEPSRSANAVEAHLFDTLLKLGAKLLRLFFEGQAAQQSKEPLPQADGPPLRYHGKRRRSYFSVFGKIHFERAYFWAAGAGGATPLDDQLELPQECYSALLCDGACFAVTTQSYEASQALLEHILGVRLSKLALEQIVARQAASVTAFYAQKPPPKPQEEGSILVVQADGKGVPMVAPSLEQVTAALIREGAPGDTASRPTPEGKHVWATLSGKDAALEQLAQQAQRRDGAHIVDRVALTDGAVALQRRVAAQFPEFTLVLDVIHAVEYLWKAANALLGERHRRRTVRARAFVRVPDRGEAGARVALAASSFARARSACAVAPARSADVKVGTGCTDGMFAAHEAVALAGQHERRGHPQRIARCAVPRERRVAGDRREGVRHDLSGGIAVAIGGEHVAVGAAEG